MATGGVPPNKCFTCQDVAATALCVDCGDMLCASCVTGHAKLTGSKQHHAHDLSALTPQSLAQSDAAISGMLADLRRQRQQRQQQTRVGEAKLTESKQHDVLDISSLTSQSPAESEAAVSALESDLREAIQRRQQVKQGVDLVQSRAPTVSTASPSADQQDWRTFIAAYYPDYLTRTHCVPPVHFNRVAYEHAMVAGLPVLVTAQAKGRDPASPYLPDPNQPAEEPSQGQSKPTSQGLSKQVTLSPPGPSKSSPQGPSKPSSQGPSQRAAPTPSGPSKTSSQALSPPRPSAPSTHSLWVEPPALSHSLPAPQDSDCRDDFAQEHVLTNLTQLGRIQGEVMFLLSQLDFSEYLNKPCYAATASCLPKRSGLVPNKRQGDFDVLLIHRQYGVMVGEIKSVGLCHSGAPSDAAVAIKVKKAAQQLEKSGDVVEHLLQDVAPGVTVRKALVLPYIKRSQLLRVLQNNANLEQEVCRVVGACDASEAATLSVCADEMSARASPWRVEGSELAALKQWWSLRVASGQDPVMTDSVYLDSVARFVGPATTVSVHCVSPPRVEVRTRGQAVAELGRRVARLVITPRQLDILTRPDDHVALVGPPGTGKTLMLGLTGLRGLREGRDVHVMSTRGYGSLAASHLLVHQLEKSVESDPALRASAGRVELHDYDFINREEDVKRAIDDLVAASRGRQLCVLMDEVIYSLSQAVGRRSHSFVAALIAAVPGVRLWTACLFHHNIPNVLHVEALKFQLRSAPAVLREVVTGTSRTMKSALHPYSNADGIPSPADGPSVVHLRHEGGGHTGEWPADCQQCGSDLAQVFGSLGVGASGNPPSPNAPAPLQYRDVLVITRNDLSEEIRDTSTGLVTRKASGVAQGLRLAGVPVCVTGGDSKPVADVFSDLKDVAVAHNDVVTVTHWYSVSGLERRVVVWLHGRRGGVDDGESDEVVQVADRVAAVSRCTTQLIVVHKPDFSDSRP